MATPTWLLTALQSDDADVASHALLLLWKHIHVATQQNDGGGGQCSPGSQDRENTVCGLEPIQQQQQQQQQNDGGGIQASVACGFEAMASRPWRRLGLLLFASDPLSVRAVVSIIMALTVPGHDCGECEWQRGVRKRVWQSDWRQLIVDKLMDCHTRAAASHGISMTTNDGVAEVATRLLLVLRRVFLDALESKLATVKDQARMVDLLVDMAVSPVDTIACVALETLQTLIVMAPDALLDANVAVHLEASRVFTSVLDWLRTVLLAESDKATGNQVRTTSTQQLKTQRCRLSFALLIHGVQQSTRIAAVIIQNDPGAFLDLILHAVETRSCRTNSHHIVETDELHAQAIELLAAVLTRNDLERQTTELVSQIRVGGALITLSWLLGHRSVAVRAAVHRVFTHVVRGSPATDLLRAVVEQGCVIVWYLQLQDITSRTGATRSNELLRFVIDYLESHHDNGEQLIRAIAQSVVRSTNPRLQRNVIVSLFLLSQSSDFIHDALFLTSTDDDDQGNHEGASDWFLNGIVRTAVCATDDVSLATSLLAMALVFTDKSSTLRLDAAAKAKSYRDLHASNANRSSGVEGAAPERREIHLHCAESAVLRGDGVLLAQHCTLIQRLLESSVSAEGALSLNLSGWDVGTVELFVRLLPLAAPQVALELQRLDDQLLVENVLGLAQQLECAKCWHGATLAISHALHQRTAATPTTHWMHVLELAMARRHPALMLRAVRVALEETPASPSVVMMPRNATSHVTQIHEASLAMWEELLRHGH